jgi:hypothetical protein
LGSLSRWECYGEQTGARFLEVASGYALTPLRLTILTTSLMPLCFALGLSSAFLSWAAGGFVLGYGAINGLTTVFKATLPLQLFAAEDYARLTGILLIPAQLAGRHIAVCLRMAKSSFRVEGKLSRFRRAGCDGGSFGDGHCMVSAGEYASGD